MGEEKLEFNLTYAMSSPSLEDACHLVYILEKLLSEEMVFCKTWEDPLEACLVDDSKGKDEGLRS